MSEESSADERLEELELALAAALTANDELRRSDEAHRLLFEASPLPLLVFDVMTLAMIAANDAALRLYGYDRDEFMRTRMSELAHDDHEAVSARTAMLGDGEAVRTRRNYRKDGLPSSSSSRRANCYSRGAAPASR